MDIPVKDIYGYTKNDGTISLYILLKLTKATQIDDLLSLFGMPWNVLKSDLLSQDFDMLLWDHQRRL